MLFARLSGSSGLRRRGVQALARPQDQRRQRISRAPAIFLFSIVGIVAIIGFTRAGTASVTTCDAANPFDTRSDTAALQACLDNYDQVLLEPGGDPGYVGYLINDTVKLRRSHALLTTGDNPRMVTLIAAPDLAAPILRVSEANNYEISFIRFDGNRENRTMRDKTCTATRRLGNVELSGSAFHVRYVESTRAVCGSAMVVGGASNFEIYRSLFYDNGRQPEEANGLTGLWADGLTVYGCSGSTIRDNDLWDNTDVDLGVNGGPGCAVYRNRISHSYKYAFAGLVAGDPSQAGGEFSDNAVYSDYNLLGFGIIAGCHPWTQCSGGYANRVWLHDNTAIGAVVNLAVDGLNGGIVEHNVMRLAQGDRVMNCTLSADYTAGHFFDLRSLEPGYVNRTYDAGTTCAP